jgi:hypothetical protein
MSGELDLDDVTHGHPVASQELTDLRTALEERDGELVRVLEVNTELSAENHALRTLLNTYNLGGWTDALGPMKRAEAAEAEVERLTDIIRREAWLEHADTTGKSSPYVPFDDYARELREVERLRNELCTTTEMLGDVVTENKRLRALLQRFYDDGYDREACAAALKGEA